MDPPGCVPVKKEPVGQTVLLTAHVKPIQSRAKSTAKTLKVTQGQRPIMEAIDTDIQPETMMALEKRLEAIAKSSAKATTKATTKRITKTRPKSRTKTSMKTSMTPKNRVTRSWALKKFHPEEFYAKTIQTFMKKTEAKRKALFYGAICSDSGVCIALGKEKEGVAKFFQFHTFAYTKEPYKTIGQPSANGFVKELKYEREGYVAYAVLKSARMAHADNLAYEYLVGKYLNDVSKRLPTFVETYGLFHYRSATNRDEMKTKNRLNRELVPLDPNQVSTVCTKSGNLCVLLQHLKDVKTLHQLYNASYFRKYLSAYVFYQIYFTLHQIRKEFTHYDLHRNNVLLYEPDENKYLQYHYHFQDKVVSYKSRYLVKIIDYGRCFFKGSKEYYQKICGEPKCDPMCGIHKGFGGFHEDRRIECSFGCSNTLYKNESHDLRLMHGCIKTLKALAPHEQMDPDYTKIINDTIYNQGTSMSYHGTKEDLRSSDKIHNVSDAYRRWETYITDPQRIQQNEEDCMPYECLGELHIYTDGRDMEYIPSE